jgi:hypothetical protein
MQTINFKGAIHDSLLNLFMIKDGFSIGEKMQQLEKQMKKRFFYASDEEIYNGIETLLKSDYYEDTPIADNVVPTKE